MLTEVDEKFETQHAVQSEADITAEEAVLSELAALAENSRLVDTTTPSYELTALEGNFVPPALTNIRAELNALEQTPLSISLQTIVLPPLRLDLTKLELQRSQTVTQFFNGVTRELFKTKPIILDSLKNLAPKKPESWPLPDESTLLIFYYLDPRSIAQCMLTCQYFLTIANDGPIRAFLFSANEKNRMTFFHRDRSYTTHIPNGIETILGRDVYNSPQSFFQEILLNLRTHSTYHPGEEGKNNGFTMQRNF